MGRGPIDCVFPRWTLAGRSLLPVVQGGMGVGISAHRLAGTVASHDAMGTIASIDLRHHHPDLMEKTRRCRDKTQLDRVNLVALDREVRAALAIADGRGIVAVNVMRAVTDHSAYVRQACMSGAQAIVMGAGLPLDLPDLVVDFPKVALIPILSDARGVAIVIKKWMRKGRLPDAVVIEHPRYAGGHLGATRLEEVDDARFDFSTVLPTVRALLTELGIEPERIPLIPAGGINGPDQISRLLALGASAVQLGTPFAVTEEGDAHPNFKKVLAEARPEDIVTFMSVAGFPARAVLTPWLRTYLKREERLKAVAKADRARCAIALDCLEHCGLRDGNAKAGQFCIDAQLSAALAGDVQRGLFFRGAASLPFAAAIRPVRALLQYLLTPGAMYARREPLRLPASRPMILVPGGSS